MMDWSIIFKLLLPLLDGAATTLDLDEAVVEEEGMDDFVLATKAKASAEGATSKQRATSRALEDVMVGSRHWNGYCGLSSSLELRELVDDDLRVLLVVFWV